MEITWDEAIDRVAKKIREVRDTTWLATERVGDADVPANRTDAFAFMGGAQNTNEECYLFRHALTHAGTSKLLRNCCQSSLGSLFLLMPAWKSSA